MKVIESKNCEAENVDFKLATNDQFWEVNLEVLEYFFGKIKLPKKETKEGDALWLNPKADKHMDKVVHKKYAPINEIQIQQMEQELQSISRVVFPGLVSFFFTICKRAQSILWSNIVVWLTKS